VKDTGKKRSEENTRPSSEEEGGGRTGAVAFVPLSCSPLGKSCVSDSFRNSPGWFLKHLPL